MTNLGLYTSSRGGKEQQHATNINRNHNWSLTMVINNVYSIYHGGQLLLITSILTHIMIYSEKTTCNSLDKWFLPCKHFHVIAYQISIVKINVVESHASSKSTYFKICIRWMKFYYLGFTTQPCACHLEPFGALYIK